MSMRRARTWAVVVTGCLAAAAGAVRAVSGSDMSRWLAGDGVDLAMRAQPMFLFGRARKQPPCIPTAAVVDGGKQAPASKLCDYPDVGCDCRNPGVPVGNPSPAFPIYFSFQRCSNASVRVAYNLFYTKDGAQPDKLFGHA